jgi:hypothetical protein
MKYTIDISFGKNNPYNVHETVPTFSELVRVMQQALALGMEWPWIEINCDDED